MCVCVFVCVCVCVQRYVHSIKPDVVVHYLITVYYCLLFKLLFMLCVVYSKLKRSHLEEYFGAQRPSVSDDDLPPIDPTVQLDTPAA